MINSKMFIPEKLRIGFNKREDTYTTKLGFVVYYDEKGKLRKKDGLESWRDHSIEPEEYSNIPTEGFVLNRNVGGIRNSWSSWHPRKEYVRVYDPRDFEFEISVKNLLFILNECSSIKGKGLEGDFVYAWEGKELILLPVNCEEYKNSKTHTSRQKKKISAKDVKEGCSYITKNGTNVMYLGKHPFDGTSWYNEDNKEYSNNGNKHIFLILDEEAYKYSHQKYLDEPGFTKLAECTSETPLNTYPDELDNFKKSRQYGAIKDIYTSIASYNTNRHYYSEKFIIPDENDKYKIIEVEGNRNSYNYYQSKYKQYTIRESKPFKLTITKAETLNLPSVSRKQYTISAEKFHNYELYNIFVKKSIDGQGLKVKL